MAMSQPQLVTPSPSSITHLTSASTSTSTPASSFTPPHVTSPSLPTTHTSITSSSPPTSPSSPLSPSSLPSPSHPHPHQVLPHPPPHAPHPVVVAPMPRGLTTSFSTLSTSTPRTAPHQEHKKNTTYVLKSLLAGAIAGSVAKTCTAPLDRVKILFQGHNRQYAQFVGTFSGPFRAVAHMWQTEGFRGLYKGHSATLVRIAPYASLNYMCYEQYKRIIIPNDTQYHPFRKMLAGSMAGCTSVFFTYPLDYVHSRMTYQVRESRYRGIQHTILHTLQHEGGIRQLYKGFGATVMGIIPYAGTSFFTYETLKEVFHHPSISSSTRAPDGDLRIRYKLICGALAGACAQTAAYPLDMIRRRQQLHGLATHIPRYKHTIDAFRNIISTEGWRGLYVGLTINYVKVGPAMAVSFVTYEQMKKWLHIDPKV